VRPEPDDVDEALGLHRNVALTGSAGVCAASCDRESRFGNHLNAGPDGGPFSSMSLNRPVAVRFA
jgi:hypothetical protein